MIYMILLPNSATMIRIKKNDGVIRKKFMNSEMKRSILPPKKPAIPPMQVPKIPEMLAATTPIINEVRVP